MQEIEIIAKSLGPRQPVQTAQADLGQHYLQMHQASFQQLLIYIYFYM